MIWPFIVSNLFIEMFVVVVSAADIEYHEVIVVVLMEVVGYIFDGISVCFFDEIGCGKGHGYDSLGDVG